jgi:tetratricopeptide (TPR) repeat protein
VALLDASLMQLEPFRLCLAALRSGRLAQAETLAADLAGSRPDSPDLWHLLGVIAVRRDRLAEAAGWLARALALAPDAPGILFDLAIVEGRVGHHAAALTALDRLLARQPDHAVAWVNRGIALRALDRHADSLASFDRALALRPTLPEALLGRGHALAALGRPREAIEGYNAALAVDPDLVDVLVGKGNVLASLDRPEEAMACFDHALTLIACRNASIVTQSHIHTFRGDTLRTLGRRDEALESLDRAVAVHPDDPDAWCARGRILLEMRAFDDALACHDRAIALDPDDSRTWDLRSRVLRELGRYGEAMESAEKSVHIKPNHPAGLTSRANCLRMVGRVEEAAVAYRQAIACDPTSGPMRFNLAICLLLAGDYANGWPEYEHRWTTERMARAKPRFHQPLWLGREEIAGRRILLHAEQGLGDTIQFCRYAPMVAAMGATVILGVQPELRPLLSSLPGVEVIDRAEAPPIFEYHAPLLSLPLAFGTTLATVPAPVPYLRVPPGHLAAWRERLERGNGGGGGEGGRKRIGIVWSGNRDHLNDHNRSLPLAMLQPILALGLPLYCLQRDLRPEDVTAFALAGSIRFLGAELRDFADTAALIMRMDMVITVDTAVAHLAGALGRPVWLLLPFAPDWRWGLHAESTPWYPTMRLFRQPAPGDWEAVIRRLRTALVAFLATDDETPSPGF